MYASTVLLAFPPVPPPTHTCLPVLLCLPTGAANFRSTIILAKRRHIFNVQGSVVSLAISVPEAALQPSGAAATSAPPSPAIEVDEFPPLPNAGGSSSNGTAAAAAAAAAVGGAKAAPGGGKGGVDGNPLLAAFAAERRLMEALRDDVEAKLASFKVSVGAHVWASVHSMQAS